MIPGYEILRELGRGGQGVVFQAIQSSTKRKVAVKVLLEGPYASKSARRHFEREVELVSHLKHPSIVSVFDSGETQDGRLFYVMEYVRGTPVTQYVREKKLSLEETLKLFAGLCDAVNHAHQKAVIHRDLKPSNILVDGEGSLKILDFGLARAITQTAETMATMTGQLLGTLPYMSPEQTKGNPELIDTRTDVYALGVVLYEMLTGAYPYPVVGEMGEVLRHISQTEPRPLARSWTKESGIGQSTRARSRLKCPIDDEVETIALKALAKEKERRYQSAADLGEDTRHYLANEPIEAKRDSRIYLLKKALWRYRAPAAVAAVFVILLAAFAVAMAVSRNRALAAEKAEAVQRLATEKERDRALTAEKAETAQRIATEKERDRALAAEADTRAVLGFFEGKVLAAARPEGQEGGLGRGVTIRAAVDAAEPLIAGSFVDRPEVEASIRGVLGTTYEYLGESGAASRQFDRSLSLRRSRLGPEHPDTLGSMHNLAGAYASAGRLQEALAMYEETLKLRKAKLGPEHPATLATMGNLAGAYRSAGRIQEALPLYEETLKLMKARLGPEHPATLASMNNLAGAYYAAGRPEEALPLNEETLKLTKARLGPEHPDTLRMMGNLAAAYMYARRLEEALPLFEETLKLMKARLGPEHPDTLRLMGNLAAAYVSARRLEEAMPLFEETLKLQKAKRGPEHPDTLDTMNNLARAYRSAGRMQEALELEETLKLQKAKAGRVPASQPSDARN